MVCSGELLLSVKTSSKPLCVVAGGCSVTCDADQRVEHAFRHRHRQAGPIISVIWMPLKHRWRSRRPAGSGMRGSSQWFAVSSSGRSAPLASQSRQNSERVAEILRRQPVDAIAVVYGHDLQRAEKRRAAAHAARRQATVDRRTT